MKRISIIIPNMNGMAFLKDCLDSLFADIDDNARVIVVDNASDDRSVEFINENYPDVNVIVNNENLGFASAVNEGITSYDSEYCILLNNDTRVRPGFYKNLVKALDDDPKVFSASAKMLMYSDETLTDDAGDIYTIFGLAFQRGNRKKAAGFTKKTSVTSACGGACIYRMSAFAKVGMFDDAFFAYREDLDLGIRAKCRGYKNIYVPEAEVVHYGSGTASRQGKRYNEFKTRYGTRNLIWVNYKNMPLLMHVVNFPFILIGMIVKGIFYARHGLLMAYFAAIGEALAGLKNVAHHPYRAKYTLNYLKLEGELIANCFRIF